MVIGPLCVRSSRSRAKAITSRISARTARRASGLSVIPRTVQQLARPEGGGSPGRGSAVDTGSTISGSSTSTTTGRESVAALLRAKWSEPPSPREPHAGIVGRPLSSLRARAEVERVVGAALPDPHLDAGLRLDRPARGVCAERAPDREQRNQRGDDDDPHGGTPCGIRRSRRPRRRSPMRRLWGQGSPAADGRTSPRPAPRGPDRALPDRA